MEKVRYMISDAANIVNVESHVLRYWEDELELDIPRNEMGHRYYTNENIQEFQRIKELKEQGYQLKAIRMIVHNGSLEGQMAELAAGVEAAPDLHQVQTGRQAAGSRAQQGPQTAGNRAQQSQQAAGKEQQGKGQPGQVQKIQLLSGHPAGNQQPVTQSDQKPEASRAAERMREPGAVSRVEQPRQTDPALQQRPQQPAFHSQTQQPQQFPSQPSAQAGGAHQTGGAAGFSRMDGQQTAGLSAQAGQAAGLVQSQAERAEGLRGAQAAGLSAQAGQAAGLQQAARGDITGAADGQLQVRESRQSILNNTDKMAQFTDLMTQIVGRAIAANNQELSRNISDGVGEQVVKELNYLMREREEAEEERFRKLDSAIRGSLKKKEPRKKKWKQKKMVEEPESI